MQGATMQNNGSTAHAAQGSPSAYNSRILLGWSILDNLKVRLVHFATPNSKFTQPSNRFEVPASHVLQPSLGSPIPLHSRDAPYFICEFTTGSHGLPVGPATRKDF